MCGPLVMLLAQHPGRWWYFFGRLCAFSLVGLVSAEIGILFFSFLAHYHINALFSLLFGGWICLIGLCIFFKIRPPTSNWLAKKSAKLSIYFSKALLQKSSMAIFLFGFSTVLLPCGQTLIVFSLIALHCDPISGLMQGCLFALLTSPALIAAMQAAHFLHYFRKGYSFWMGGAVLCIGTLTLLRGLAELNYIPHLILNPSADPCNHLVFF